MYHVPVQSLAQRMLSHIRRHKFLQAGDRVGVAVSGGIDSVALLRLLLELRGELGIVLSVVHFNHQLRGAESDGDLEFVANLARGHDLEFFCDSDDVAHLAAEKHVSVEAAAREVRYGFFRHLLGEPPFGTDARAFHGTSNSAVRSSVSSKLDKIVTAHTIDDQAETVLMRVIRGSGMRGLTGIHPRIAVEADDGETCGEIVRPLLETRRAELGQYLEDVRQSWREDSTNTDTSFLRNRVRKLVVPLLEREFNPAVAESLADLAEIAYAEQDYWENEIAGWMGTVVHWLDAEQGRETGLANLVQIGMRWDEARPRASVDRAWFLAQPIAVQRRVVKAVGDQARLPLELKHVEEILDFAAADGSSGKELALPARWKLLREREHVVFIAPSPGSEPESQDYQYELFVPGKVLVSEIGSTIEAVQIRPDGPGYNPERLLNAECLSGPLTVRNWRAGDRYWPAHTKSPKKIKELLQRQHAVRAQRKLWPVVVSGDEIVWVRGLPPPERIRAAASGNAILIREIFLDSELET